MERPEHVSDQVTLTEYRLSRLEAVLSRWEGRLWIILCSTLATLARVAYTVLFPHGPR
jgi:hypothetical protein